eukprot:TRINITY_DN91345_c0_g1_i1.p1 TRINITY_DN91345_c0_g1~~TRINITY_DN91345_c0_g1_i1.p1  ORF type:complete len:423 (+),score=119.75 TRINITY_DN91345_c0_g1_i1:122-1390(+)
MMFAVGLLVVQLLPVVAADGALLATSSPAVSAAMAWLAQEVGAEVLVFLATALIAVALQATFFKPQPANRSDAEVHSASCAAPGQRQQPTMAAPRREEQRSLIAASSRPPLGQQDLAKLAEGIVTAMRGRPSPPRELLQILENYRRLRDQLQWRRLKLSELGWRHSCLDLYAAMVQCVIRLSQFPVIEELLDDMREQGVPRTLPFYESALKQLAGQRQYDFALRVYDRMAGDGIRPSAVTASCLVSFAAEAGKYQRAVDFFRQLSQMTKPSIRAWMTLLRVHNKQQNWIASLQALRAMQKQGLSLDTLALNVLLSTAIACDKLADAEQLLAEIQAPIADVVTYNTLIKGYMQRGEVDAAMTLLDRMQAQGVEPNAISFNTISDKLPKNHSDKAAALAGKAALLGTSGARLGPASSSATKMES